jgi:Xaa-Pro aminopeptidase
MGAAMKTIHAALVLVLLAPLAARSASAPLQKGARAAEGSLERPGDGKPVCGLGKAFHAGRRAALRTKLGSGLVLVRGLPDTRDYVRFHQDKVFWYLTGVESPGAALLMDAGNGREILFLPEKATGRESWEGEMWDAGDAWVGDLTGFKEALPSSKLLEVLRELTASEKKVWLSLAPHIALSGCIDRAEPYDRSLERDPLDGRASREKALRDKLVELFGVEVVDLSPALDELRRVKTPEEVAAMRRAGRAGALAMAEAMRSTRPGLGEWDLDALMSFVQVREGAVGPAYHAIVGSGPNSLVLHYSASSRTMQDGDVVLIDYAPEADHYTSDITRTWPVNGKFSPRQAELYDAVLAAQKAGIAAVKPGASFRDVGVACSAELAKRGFGGLQRHGPTHYIGLEVHDVGRSKTFEPGESFTVEPGLYEQETGIGIRIEDVVVVTKDGCEVITADVPKERDEIERLIRSEGLLDWMAKRK